MAVQQDRWIIHQFTQIAKKFLKENYDMELGIPITINGRLKSVYGRFRHMGNRKQSVRIEMSRNYIEHQEWNTVVETLKHELIHYALYELDKPYRDGTAYFEAEIQKHGSHSSGTVKYKGKVQEYECQVCGRKFRRQRRYPNNARGYSHCGTQIRYNGEKII